MLKKILISILTLVLISCVSTPQNPTNQIVKGKTLSIKGKVVEINRGKDGYTAKIETSDGKTHSATISSVALEKNYREVKVGEVIEVEGEDTSGDGNSIRVTILR